MHAIVIRSTLNDFERAIASLRDEVIPRVKQAPGFVSAQWVRLDESTGTAMLTFETAEETQAALEMVKASPPVGVTIDSIAAGEVVARI